MKTRLTVLVGLVSIGMLWGGLAVGKEVPAEPTITLERAVHFLSPDGADTVLAPGVYVVEAKDEKGPQRHRDRRWQNHRHPGRSRCP